MGQAKDREIAREEAERDNEDRCGVCLSPESECACGIELQKMDDLVDRAPTKKTP